MIFQFSILSDFIKKRQSLRDVTQNHNKKLFECNEKKKTFKCEICDKFFSQKSTLKWHTKVHEERYKRKWSCTQCNKTTTTKYGIQMHIRHVHENVPREVGEVIDLWRCGQCEKWFNRKSNRDQHEKYVHQNLPRPRYPRN